MSEPVKRATAQMFTRCRPLSRARVLFLEFDPGACAPGFMLSPASRALLASASQAERLFCKAVGVQRLYPADSPDNTYLIPSNLHANLRGIAAALRSGAA